MAFPPDFLLSDWFLDDWMPNMILPGKCGKKISRLIVSWSCEGGVVGFSQRRKVVCFMGVTLYLGPDNIWFGNSAGFARKRDGDTFVGYVVVWTSVDLRGHCWRSRSWNAAVRLACSMITGLGQAALSALQACLHYKPMMNRNLACHYTPLIKEAFSSGRAANEPLHCNYCRRGQVTHIFLFCMLSQHIIDPTEKFPHSETAHKMFYRQRFTDWVHFSSSWKYIYNAWIQSNYNIFIIFKIS